MFCKKDCPPGHTRPGVMGTMEPRKREAPRSTLGEDLRLNPQLRLCARFDDVSIAEFPVAAPGRWASAWWTTAQRRISNKEARGPDEFRPGPGWLPVTPR